MFGKLKNKLKDWTEKVSQKDDSDQPEPKKTIEKKTSLKKEIKPKKSPLKKEKPIENPIKKEPLPAEETKKETKSFFKKLTSKNITISEEDFEKYSEDLEFLLLENNVALEVADKIISELKEKIINQEFEKKDLEELIRTTLKEIIEEVLVEPFDLIRKIKEKKEPYVILFCGINGSGKTTTIAKFANKLKKENISCVMSASDTFRAAAIDQLKKHGEKLNIPVISSDYGTDPTAVSFDTIKYAKKNKIDCVLIDTAGRIHTAKNLMAEIEKINRICKPDTKIFIGESITGNDSVEQVKAFDEAVNLDGIILSKADIDEKGGTALSVGYITKKPILFLGTGQEYDKLEKFDKKKFLEKLDL
ncbi:signal recognition particle-docking protein FtsY [archaeon]|jgi:fused signal recognition particle receptor|nr:signal recognition particle-docking protein FtsY [archaeon]